MKPIDIPGGTLGGVAPESVPTANRYQGDQSHERLANARSFGAKKTNINR